MTETSEPAAKDRLVSLGTLCADKITESDVDTFIDLLRLYCRSTAVQAVLQITTAFREKLAGEGAEQQLRQKVAYLDLEEDDDVGGDVLAELVALSNMNGEGNRRMGNALTGGSSLGSLRNHLLAKRSHCM